MSRLWSPHALSDDLFLWLDGKDTSGLGTVPTNGTSIDVWQDKSRNRLKFIKDESSGLGLPTYVSATSSVDFDGNQTLECISTGAIDDFPTGDSHFFTVASCDTVTNEKRIITVDAVSGSDHDILYIKANGAALLAHAVATVTGVGLGEIAHGTTVAQGATAIFENFYTVTGTDTVGVNVNGGTAHTLEATVNIDGDSTIRLMNSQAENFSTHGTIKEVLWFKRSLTSSEIAIIQGYLEHKYNLDVLPSDHVYKTNAPLITNPFNGAHKLNPREPIQVVKMYLDECDNVFGVNSGLSTCNISSPVAADSCFNTKHSCVNLTAYRVNNVGVKELVFSSEVGRNLSSREFFAHPALISVTSAPTEIVPTKGISVRSNITIKIRDFHSTDKGQDPYYLSRTTIALENGTYFQKLIERNPHYFGRRIEIFDGYIDFDGTPRLEDGKRSYIIDSMHLTNDVCTIKCKDPLSLGDELKSKVPTPSRYSLNADLSNSATGSISVKLDGFIENSASITTTSFALFETTFGANGEAGFIRINEEIMPYTSVISGSVAGGDAAVSLNITAGGRTVDNASKWGTSPDGHSEDDAIQQCISFGTYGNNTTGSVINEVAYQLLVTEAGIPATAINNTAGGVYSWTDEKTEWLSSFKINAIISEPEEANKLVNQLGSMVGVNFFYDDLSAQIVMKAEMPETDKSGILTITDVDIVEDSLKILNSEKDRISRVYYYYNIKNGVEDRDKKKSFKNLYVNIDSESEGSEEYGKESNKVIYAWGVNNSSTATSISQRILNRFKNVPKTVTFQLDAGGSVLQVGDHFFLETKHIRSLKGGIKPLTEMQCISNKFNDKLQVHEIKAKQFRFTNANFGQVTANDVAAFSTGGGSGTPDDPYTGVRATESYICSSTTLKMSTGGEPYVII